jgi:hypothetical protein
MDPYIEAAGLWEDFHTKLIGEIERTLSQSLPDRYVVRAGERSYIDYLDADEGVAVRAEIRPDVAIRRPARIDESVGASAAVAEAADSVVMHALLGSPRREPYLEIQKINPQRRLITCIEILSPSNKRFASVGWQQYVMKRQLFLQGYANLVEIDLVRSGRRMPMEEPWPDAPYSLLVMRKEEATRCTVKPAHFDRPLGRISVPLAPPDADVALSLQPLIDAVYARSKYFLDIDYRQAVTSSLAS